MRVSARWLTVLLAAGCGFVCFGFGRFILIDADEANFYGAARDMARGHLLLRGWSLPPDNFWTLDLAGMAALIGLTGAGPIAPHVMAGVWFAAVVAGALTLANRPDRPWSGRRLLPVVLFVGLPLFAARGAIGFLTFTPYHVATLAACLWGLVLVQRWRPGGGAPGVVPGAALFVVCTAIAFGDFLGVVVFMIPMAVIAWFGRSDPCRIPAAAIVIAAASFATAGIARHLVAHAGGFTTSGLHPAFIGIDAAGARLRTGLAAILDLFGINLFGRTLLGHHGDNAVAPLARLAAFAMIARFAWRDLWLRRRDPALRQALHPVSRVLLLGIGIDTAAAFASDFHLHGEEVIRYLYPAMVYAVILFAREASVIGRGAFVGGLAVTVGISALAWHDGQTHAGPFVDPFGVGHQVDPAPILSALDIRHLRRGYAGYWDAALLRLVSREHVDVRSIRFASGTRDAARQDEERCPLVPYPWIGHAMMPIAASSTDERLFVVTRQTAGEPFATLTQTEVVAALGAPDDVVAVDGSTRIDIYRQSRVRDRCAGLAAETDGSG